MSSKRDWYLISYDIREPARWRKVYKVLKGYGERIQYSIFRCKLTRAKVEKLRWELTDALDVEDSILFICICDNCVERIPMINRPEEWSTDDQKFAIL